MLYESEPPSRLRISEFFRFILQTFGRLSESFGKMGQIDQISVWKRVFFALGRLKNHNVPHLHPNSTMFMPLDRLQLKIYAFSGKFNVCSKCVLLTWIKICRDFTLQTQIFYSEILGVDSDFTQNFWGKIWRLEVSGPEYPFKPPPRPISANK